MWVKKIISGCSIFFLFTGFIVAQTVTYYQTGEEFVGPFPSWKNVKTDFGAKGDGSTDDAAAIILGLQSLAKVQTINYSVLYFPAGTYVINSTVYNTSALGTRRATGDDFNGVSVIGEDPATTVIKWNGATNGDMMVFDGWYIKISRLTFDGQNKAGTGLLRWGSFGTGSEISDIFFKDIPGNGLCNGGSVGANGSDGQAEQMTLRCKFINCGVGVNSPNMNSLDHWITYCLFQDCGIGIENGGFQCYNSVFLRSKIRDMSGSYQPTAMVNNISINSANFGNFNPVVYAQKNRIYNSDTMKSSAYETIYLDNSILSKTGQKGLTLFESNPTSYTGALIVGNTFSTTNANSIAIPNYPNNRQLEKFDNKFVDPSALTVPSTVELPATPPKVNRKIFEVSLTEANDALELQNKIIAACAEPAGSKPVLHIAKGSLALSATVVIPGNKEFSIVGDGNGYGSSISGGTKTGLKLLAPSRVTLKDLSISGNPGLLIEVNDVAGSRIQGNQFCFGGPAPESRCLMGLVVDSVENSNLTFYGSNIQRFDAGVLVKGGPTLASGGTTPGQVAFLSGSSSHGQNMFNVQNKGKLIAQAMWYEGNFNSRTLPFTNLTAQSSGDLSITTMFWADVSGSSYPACSIDRFNGSFTFIGNKFASYNQVYGNWWRFSNNCSNSKVLNGFNLHGLYSIPAWQTMWRDSSSPAAEAASYSNHNGYENDYDQFPNVYNKVLYGKPDSVWIAARIANLRSLYIEKDVPKDSGLTDVRLVRVTAGCNIGQTAVRIRSTTPVGIIARGTLVLNSKNSMNRFQKLMPGQMVSFPQGITRVEAFDLRGRIILSKIISNDHDVLMIKKEIQALSRNGSVMVQMQ